MKTTEHYLKAELYDLIQRDPSVFDFLQQGTLDGIWYWDIDSPENEWMSPGFWTTLGYDPAEMQHLASEWQDRIHPEDLAVALENFSRHCENPSHPYDQIVRYRHKNGATVWVRCRGVAIRDETGKPVRMLGAHTDLTPQKNAEDSLKESERFLEAMFDAIQDGVSVLDRDLTIVRINETMKGWFPDQQNIVGRKCYDVIHGRNEPCETCPAVRAMKTGKLEVDEVPFTQEDGTPGVRELFANPMIDDSGQITAVVEFVRDISKRKKSEAFLQDREQLYRSLFENNRSVMLLIEPDTGALFDANPSACSFYGYPRAELTGMKITDINILSPEEVHKEMARARTEARTHFNFRHRLADGSVRDVEVYSGPINVGGRDLLCSVIHDISERKIAEREREQLIGDLQQAMSEVKTLRGFIPICSSCKKIRDDKGYWNQIEAYLLDHSEAKFSHGICPDCMKELYPDLHERS
ncbi:MAG: PAS domain S-box protein [bacterium]